MISLKIDFHKTVQKVEFFTKRTSQSGLLGEQKSVYRQRDIEFEEYKPFMWGDDAALIDWKASARFGKLLLREYSSYRNAHMVFVFDTSNSMLFSSHSQLKCEYAAEFIAAFTHNFLRNANSVGICLVHGDSFKLIPPSIGLGQQASIIRELADTKNYGGEKNVSSALKNLQTILPKNSVVVLVSDFIGMDEQWKHALKTSSIYFDLYPIIIRDPADLNFNEKIGHAIVEDPFSPKKVLIDIERIRDEYQLSAQQQLAEVQQYLRKYRSKPLLLMTDESFVKPSITYFMKERR